MPGKTIQQLEQEARERQAATRAAQSAERIRANAVIESARQQIEADREAERARMLGERLRLREVDPPAWYALSDGARMEALRFESERRGLGGRENRDASRTYSGFVDPRFPKILEYLKTGSDRYEAELAKLSPTDKLNYARWAALQPR